MRNSKPNLLLIMCDQLRADVLGCYGNTYVQTPNIDRLARNGICFDRVYSQTPVCMPTRHALISGMNAFEIGMLENTDRRKEIENPLAKLIRSQRYYTCAIGKMHFAPTREHFGFDKMYLSEEIPTHIEDDEFLLFLRENGYGHVIEPHGKRSETYYVPQVSELPEHMHATSWTADVTCDVIRKNRNRPFFIFSSFIKPHPPFDPCEPYNTMYRPDEVRLPIRAEEEFNPVDRMIETQNDYKVNGIENISDEDLRRIRAYYYACVTQVDRQIGKILDTLDEYGLTENTLIVFTADHGEMLGDHYAFGKRTYYEQSTRIPYIVSWPSILPQNERRQEFAILQDIYSTLISAAGGCIPDGTAGMDLLPVCKGEDQLPRQKIMAEYGVGNNLKFMLRWGNYKYIYHVNGGLENLYDLENDIDELHDIASISPDICKWCRAELVSYYKEKGFDEALDGDSLRKCDYEKVGKRGFLNQYPRWAGAIDTR